MNHVCTDKMAGSECADEGEFTCHDGSGDETGEHLSVLPWLGWVCTLEAKHLQDGALRCKHGTTADCADFNAGHRDRDE